MRTQRGEAVLIVVIVLALLGGGLVAFRPKWLHGDSKRAKTSAETTQALVDAQKNLSATAAASVAKIGEANAVAPDSPSKNFIAREVPVALAVLEPPDPMALVEAERRKNAVMQGRLEEAQRLYGDQAKIADMLRRENTAALAAKRASDDELTRVAAERLTADRTASRWLLVALACGGLYLWVKISHIGPGALAEAVSDMRKQGALKAITALDGVTTRFQQKMVRTINRMKDQPQPEKND